MRYEEYNFDGTGPKRLAVYDLIPTGTFLRAPHNQWHSTRDYWGSVTDIPCPLKCDGIIRWAENGYVPGYRICDRCSRHFMAHGDSESPSLLLYPRKGGELAQRLSDGRRGLDEALRSYLAEIIVTDGRVTLEMRDPNDNSQSRYQYRRGDYGLERRVLTDGGNTITDWRPFTTSEIDGMRSVRGEFHPVLDLFGS